jgi:hypothetical protein
MKLTDAPPSTQSISTSASCLYLRCGHRFEAAYQRRHQPFSTRTAVPYARTSVTPEATSFAS